MSEQDFYFPRLVAGPAPRPGAPAGAPRLSSLSAILARIEEVVEEETAGIRADTRFDLKASNARKSRHLYELNKAVRDFRPADLGEEHRRGILRLREKLAANEEAIRAHLSAVSEVAGMLRDAIERAEADGTYSSGAFGRGRA